MATPGSYRSEGSEGRIVIYRSHFARLLAWPKPLRDQLILELPTLQAFRSGEVSSFKAEYVDLERWDLQVLDSKKHKLSMVPLDPVVAEHLAEYILREGLTEGILLRALPKASRKTHKPGSKTKGIGLSITHIDRIWAKWCSASGVPYMSARMGRAYFATKWHFVEHKSLFNLMTILRHDDLQSTEHYLARIVTYEDVKNEFYYGLKSPFASQCARFEKCPLSAPECSCKMFTPRVEVQALSSRNTTHILRVDKRKGNACSTHRNLSIESA